MKFSVVLLVLSSISAYAAAEPATVPAAAIESTAADPSSHPHMSIPVMEEPEPLEIKLTQKARVLSAINTQQYSYLKVSQDKKTIWLAGAPVAAKKGDMVSFDDGMVAANFHSNILNRDFPSITFVNKVVVLKK